MSPNPRLPITINPAQTASARPSHYSSRPFGMLIEVVPAGPQATARPSGSRSATRPTRASHGKDGSRPRGDERRAGEVGELSQGKESLRHHIGLVKRWEVSTATAARIAREGKRHDRHDRPTGRLRGAGNSGPAATPELVAESVRAGLPWELTEPYSHPVRCLVDAGCVKPAGKITDQGRSSELDEGRDSSPATYSGR
jgi:hypothetical protein